MYKSFCIKKAFTFAELMVSLVIISIITVVLYPTIADLSPNNNKYLFKATYKTIENIVSEISDTSEIPNTTNADNANKAAACMCHEFMDRLNVTTLSAGKGCASTATACPNGKTYTTAAGANNTFVTTNGVRWAFRYDTANNRHEILVDVNPANNTKTASITIDNNVNPQPAGWANNTLNDIWAINSADSSNGIFYTNNTLTQDTFLIRVAGTTDANQVAGKINIASLRGYDHLKDN